jgi:hypothetical protein
LGRSLAAPPGTETGALGGAGSISKQFFFEKKNQKTFVIMVLAERRRVRQVAKVFASFFKKKRFLASRWLPASRRAKRKPGLLAPASS